MKDTISVSGFTHNHIELLNFVQVHSVQERGVNTIHIGYDTKHMVNDVMYRGGFLFSFSVDSSKMSRKDLSTRLFAMDVYHLEIV